MASPGDRSRFGHKPRHSHRAAETTATAVKRARAKSAFVQSVKRALSKEEWSLLIACNSDSEVARWAENLHVNAPGMIEHARSLLTTFSADDLVSMANGDYSCDESFGARMPPEWETELARLDTLPSDFMRQSLRDRMDDSYIETYRRIQLLTTSSANLADDELLLARLSANPFHESRDHFLSRAGDHFDARNLRLHKIGLAAGFSPEVPRDQPEMNKHADWLVRNQLRGERASAIAAAEGLNRPDQRDTVNKAIREMATLIELPPRFRRGRPAAGK